MGGANMDRDDVEVYGDEQHEKLDNIFRVGLHNIFNLPEDRRTSKSRQLIDYIVHKGYDVFLMAEIGLNWRKVGNNDRWFECIWGKFKTSRSIFAHNVNELSVTKVHQPGGVGAIASEEVTHRVIATGKDPTGLGRWCWIHFQGRNGIRIRTIAVYRPCNAPGATTTYQQQLRHLRQHRSDHQPREALYEDLYQACSTWIGAGDQLIIGIDANEDIREGQTESFFRTLGMKEAILSKHDSSPPATQNRNTRRQPIDGLFVTPGLKAVAAGYEAFGVGCPSDHRVLWADFSYENAFGFNSPPLMRPETRRLNNKNPRMVEKYVKEVRKALVESGIAKRLFELESRAEQQEWNAEFQKEYDDIQHQQIRIQKLIEFKLRKLRMGGVPWSPKLQSFRTEIELWAMILRKRKGIRVSNTRIRQFMGKSGIWDAFSVNLEDAEAKLKSAHKKYRVAKKNAAVWRDDFMVSLAEVRSERNKTTPEQELKLLRRVSDQKTQARNVKRMLKKLGQNATTKLYYTQDGVRVECTEKISMENACISENTSRFSQASATPPMIEPLISDLGYLADTDAAERILAGTYDIPADLDPYAALLIRELRMPDSIRNHPSVTNRFSTEDHTQGWRKQKEAISADPDGLTFSHYKAGTTEDVIAQFDATLRSLPYQHGFTPAAWIPVTDVEILKKAGVYDVEKCGLSYL